tara:strand:- start:1732 stop:2112 length:381 start_codon:yes stop_codon:yes gene_type:complete
MAKTIKWGSYCVPQEQVNATGNNTKFYLDGDSGRKFAGDDSYTISTYTAPAIVTSTTTLNASQDFVAIKALSIDSGTVLISLDAGSSTPIKLLAGECFASKISDAARVQIVISGVARVEYWSALTS